jgi:anti-sigma regulatory factor (Ser/Thr protein kinase)
MKPLNGAAPATMDLHVDPLTSLTEMRRWISAVLDGLDEDHLYDVLLVASELVSNVYDHTSGPGQIRISRDEDPDQVLVEVDDLCPEHPTPGRSTLGQHRGRGIAVVEHVSHEWGVRSPTGQGKTVWALIRVPS